MWFYVHTRADLLAIRIGRHYEDKSILCGALFRRDRRGARSLVGGRRRTGTMAKERERLVSVSVRRADAVRSVNSVRRSHFKHTFVSPNEISVQAYICIT